MCIFIKHVNFRCLSIFVASLTVNIHKTFSIRLKIFSIHCIYHFWYLLNIFVFIKHSVFIETFHGIYFSFELKHYRYSLKHSQYFLKHEYSLNKSILMEISIIIDLQYSLNHFLYPLKHLLYPFR